MSRYARQLGRAVFTTGQVAAICGVASRTVSNWIDAGQLKGYRIPTGRTGEEKDRRVTREELLRFMDEWGIPRSGLEMSALIRVIGLRLDPSLQEQLKAALYQDYYFFVPVPDPMSLGMELARRVPDILIVDFIEGKSQSYSIIDSVLAADSRRASCKCKIICILNEDDPGDNCPYPFVRKPFIFVDLGTLIAKAIPICSGGGYVRADAPRPNSPRADSLGGSDPGLSAAG